MDPSFTLPSSPKPPTTMLLMGMWMSLTKKPMKPMRPKPIAVAMAILVNSFLKIRVKFITISSLLILTYQVWFGASFDQPDGVPPKLLEGLHCQRDLIQAPVETVNSMMGGGTKLAIRSSFFLCSFLSRIQMCCSTC